MGKICNQALGFWRDGTGATATTFTVLADQTPALPASVTAILDAMAALSNCAYIGKAYQNAQVLADTPGTGDYPSVADRVVFKLRYSGVAYPSRIEIPAPIDGIFLSDNRLVDMSNPLVEALVDALIAHAGDNAGNPVVGVEQGRRQMVNRGPF